jgi:hypothetical protein
MGLINRRGSILGLILFYCGLKAIERLFAQGLYSIVSHQTLLKSQEPLSAPLINPYHIKQRTITIIRTALRPSQ